MRVEARHSSKNARLRRALMVGAYEGVREFKKVARLKQSEVVGAYECVYKFKKIARLRRAFENQRW